MKRNITSYMAVVAMVLSISNPASAQYWEEAAVPIYIPAPLLVYADTVHDWLLAAGQNQIFAEGDYYLPLMRYNGTQWDTLGLFGNQVRSAVVYHDTLIVGGAFEFMAGNTIGHIAYYAGGTWHPYGEFGDQWGSGLVEGLRVIDGVLYAVGIFEDADGQSCNGLAMRVGGHWEPLPGWSDIELNPEPWLHDIIRFQGKLVVAGNFSTSDLTTDDMLQYDGNAWVPVCTNCLNGGLDGVAAMAEYQGELYVGGIFYYASGNAGQGIMRWDGGNWYSVGPVGDGLQLDNYSDQYSPDISALQVRDGLLYIGGAFRFVEHEPTPAGICAWDGTDFCVLEGEPFSDYYAPFAFYHDTLYGGTSSGVPDLSMRGVIRYLGELCTSSIGVEEILAAANALQLSWSSSGELALLGLADGPHQVQVYDAQGRLVLDTQVRSAAGRSESVFFSERGAALYLVVVDHQRTARLVPIQ